ncbi:nucleoside hydrolase [Actinophytocola sp.]|uniref:nucleoside hydrolase n=1 Tax=Actinophytocola sp. TaxID=1872138 RepID=UPI0025B7B3E5|nr:nucleoside hydrolase [Actinophytocola sp.]
MPRKLIVDTDPGIDDAVAIFLAAASPELDLLGLTTVFGNCATAVATRNALILLDVADRPDVPVARGATDPVASTYLGAIPHIHGTDGMGDGGELPAPTREPVAESAAEFLCRTVAEHPGEVTILAVGPLTNLALALRLRPDLDTLVDQVVVMGGNALVPGNATPAAEANMLNDPEAADVVFGARWPVTMVGLDVTHKANLRGADLDRITAADTPAGRHLARALPLYRAFMERTNGLDGIYTHDPSEVAYLIDPTAFRTEAWPRRGRSGWRPRVSAAARRGPTSATPTTRPRPRGRTGRWSTCASTSTRPAWSTWSCAGSADRPGVVAVE